jgi:hypothetical protein
MIKIHNFIKLFIIDFSCPTASMAMQTLSNSNLLQKTKPALWLLGTTAAGFSTWKLIKIVGKAGNCEYSVNSKNCNDLFDFKGQCVSYNLLIMGAAGIGSIITSGLCLYCGLVAWLEMANNR